MQAHETEKYTWYMLEGPRILERSNMQLDRPVAPQRSSLQPRLSTGPDLVKME